jgi:hypothetical protein
MSNRSTNPLTEDELRTKVLEYFYYAYKRPRGMASYKIPISKALSDLSRKGLDRKDALRGIIYLVETQWIKKEIEESQFFTGKQTISNKKTYYKISSDGIDFFEGLSKFQKENKAVGINITNLQGVVTLGNNNYIRNEFSDLFTLLEELGKQIRLSGELKDEEKIAYQAEVDTIKAQLAKPKPDRDIVGKAWSALKAVATVNGVVNFYTKVAPLVEALLKGG